MSAMAVAEERDELSSEGLQRPKIADEELRLQHGEDAEVAHDAGDETVHVGSRASPQSVGGRYRATMILNLLCCCDSSWRPKRLSLQSV